MIILSKIKDEIFNKAPIAKQLLDKARLRKIKIERIRCQVSPLAETQGFSGQEITSFPPCKYYKLYLGGETKEAHNEFSDWLYHCLINLNYWKASRRDGGWANGSLVHEIEEIHHKNKIVLDNFPDANLAYVKKGIEIRVNYYFSLLNSIKTNGFSTSFTPPVICYYKNGFYYLIGGHHRVSALHALGKKTVPARIHRNKGRNETVYDRIFSKVPSS